MLSELDQYPLVLLFATPQAHKGLGDPGSGVVAELIKTYSPRVAIVSGRDPKHELLGRSLVVCPGRLADGRYAVVDIDSSTLEQSQLPDRITLEH
jgi:Icc-related predicted phosphoesterase